MRPSSFVRFDRGNHSRGDAKGLSNPKELTRPLLEHLTTQEALCAELEAVADGLPNKACSQRCLHLARMIGPTVKKAHRFEEDRLFPVLRVITPPSDSFDQTLTRLQYEHFEDEAYAEEIADALTGFVTGSARPNAETLGYMLRGFFEAMRRHIAFEREYIVPLLALPAGAPRHA